ncbi:MAG: DUF29 domain-containing protein [Candidatus Competibacteraceae bacterium]|nr:DUF29 domain-containing protein [Candidatus Competibacteraceae bacterium]
MIAPAYEQDRHAWATHTATLLRQGRMKEVDLTHLTEELDSMGASERRELYSRLKVLLVHLLKWRYQPERQSDRWGYAIDEQRDQLIYLLRQSPSLKPTVPGVVEEAYLTARRFAARETRLPPATFPERSPFTVDQILDPDYWPDAA